MLKKRKVGIVASGGDGSGMNACVYYLTKHFNENGFEVVYFEGGYDGLCKNKVVNVSLKELRTSINEGGCIVKSGRSPLYMTDEGRKMAAATQAKNGLECVIIIGGNGSLKGMIDGRPFGLRSVGIPATIDNDVYYTSYSIGYDSAANANMQLVKSTKNSCFSSNRIPIIEVMGRDCGKLSLATAIGSGADICVVKEVPKTIDDVLEEVKELKRAGKENVLMVCAEKNLDLPLLAEYLEKLMGMEARLTVMGYAQRGPDTSAFDRVLAAMYAHKAFELVRDKQYGYVVGAHLNHAFSIPVEEALAKPSNFDIDFYNAWFKKKQ